MATASILIVDDESTNLLALKQILESEYRLIFAKSGLEALAAAEKHKPALLLLDVQMPDLDGYAVCRRLKANPDTEGISVIFITGLNETGNEAEGFAAGCVDYIVKPVSAAIVRARVRNHLSLVRATSLMKSHRDAIHMLGAAGHYNDTDTGVHIWRMAAYAKALAKEVGWEDEQCNLLELAAPMHDTGKIGIPDSVLRKPGPLTNEEWKVMRQHTRIGYEILNKSDAPLFQLAAVIALRHHEKWDGGGYPDGLAGDAIPEAARIVAVADVFDSLSMKRPYKEPWPLEQVVDALEQGRGNHFEPRLVDHFKTILPEILQIQTHWRQSEQPAAIIH
ncbi:HD domain-containing phosphohydrolase [Chromobacterium phragmitis]|uniref:Two-component system response regulator n=1 Tax=Chromobacterium phragmitis TaxID=2202141 RepID=A0A344UN54_9NEIS|nr:HD domain-containing phosphohydrolase [Chromobacterium phragmitis]AXE36702.1 two-component system response regulator [Chromobacterium phragmitis]